MVYAKKISLLNYINYLIILYAFLLPISRAAITGFGALIFILWFFSDNFKKNIQFLLSKKTILYLIAFVGFSILSLLWSSNISSGMFYIKKYWYFLPIFAIASTLQKRYVEITISAFLLGMLISEIISYGVFFELWSFKRATVDFPNPFMHHIQYSMFLAFTSLLLLNRIFYEKELRLKIPYLLFFLTTTANLFLNSGRTGQVAFALSIFAVAFLNIKNKITAFFSIVILVTSIFYISYNISPNFEARFDAALCDINKVLKHKDYSTSLGLRAGAWIVGGELFFDNPILGIGVTNDMNALKDTISQNHPEMEDVKQMLHYHNFYIQTAVHLGLVGLFFYIMIFYNILKLDIEDRYYYNLAVLFVVVFSLSNITETIFHQKFSQALFALFVGIFIALCRIKEEVK